MMTSSSQPMVNPQETLELMITLQDLVHDLITQMRTISETFVAERPAALAIDPESW